MEKFQSEREMGNHERGDTMSVEIAIERELAYRKKIKMLGLEPYGDSEWKEFLPLQAPVAISKPPLPSACVISRINQEAPSSIRLQCHVPISISKPPLPSSCVIPRITQEAPSNIRLQCHAPKPSPSSISGPSFTPLKRKAPILSSNLNTSHGDNLFCKVCQVPCSSHKTFKMHISGRQHWAKVKELKSIVLHKPNKPLRCVLCQISCTDETSLRLHLTGQKHIAKMQKAENGGKDGEEEASEQKWCGMCKIWCMNDAAFKQHLEGKKHVMKIHRVREKIALHGSERS